MHITAHSPRLRNTVSSGTLNSTIPYHTFPTTLSDTPRSRRILSSVLFYGVLVASLTRDIDMAVPSVCSMPVFCRNDYYVDWQGRHFIFFEPKHPYNIPGVTYQWCTELSIGDEFFFRFFTNVADYLRNGTR